MAAPPLARRALIFTAGPAHWLCQGCGHAPLMFSHAPSWGCPDGTGWGSQSPSLSMPVPPVPIHVSTSRSPPGLPVPGEHGEAGGSLPRYGNRGVPGGGSQDAAGQQGAGLGAWGLSVHCPRGERGAQRPGCPCPTGGTHTPLAAPRHRARARVGAWAGEPGPVVVPKNAEQRCRHDGCRCWGGRQHRGVLCPQCRPLRVTASVRPRPPTPVPSAGQSAAQSAAAPIWLRAGCVCEQR